MGEHWVDTDSVDGDEVPDVVQDGVLNPLNSKERPCLAEATESGLSH
jgi:hypothetical protein